MPGQEIVNGDTESNDAPQEEGVCRGGRNRTPREMYVPSMRDNSYAKEKYKGVGFHMAKKISTEEEEIRDQFAGTGYCTK